MNGIGMSRAQQILAGMKERRWRRTSQIVTRVLLVQPGVSLALLMTAPHTGSVPQLWVATTLVSLIAIAALRRNAVSAIGRHLAGGALGVWPALILETARPDVAVEIYVACALALLTYYRDWRVLVTATTCFLTADFLANVWLDHISTVAEAEKLLGFGLLTSILAFTSIRGNEEMEDAAARESTLEATAATVQQKVKLRTLALQDRTERYRALVENTEAMPFEYDVTLDKMVYLAPQAERMLGSMLDVMKEAGFFSATIHADDLGRARTEIRRFIVGKRPTTEPLDVRLWTRDQLIHMRFFMSSRTNARVRGVGLDVTRQVLLEQDLRQAQKLESVGRLAAGIAHEINTPVQFVRDSLSFVGQGIGDLVSFIKAQQAHIGAADTALGDLAEQLDLDFAMAELPSAIALAIDGASRIAEIVRSMKIFAHPQHGEMTVADLATSIESTLTIARAEYKDVADVETHLDERLEIPCYLGEINQVVLNLVVNAAHAIADAVEAGKPRGRITVRLCREGEHAVIAVGDTGTGIPPAVQEHLFEQFYTTKAVGKGSGQGLALARAVVVDKHGGKLTYETTRDVGTTFYVRLPIVPRVARSELIDASRSLESGLAA